MSNRNPGGVGAGSQSLTRNCVMNQSLNFELESKQDKMSILSMLGKDELAESRLHEGSAGKKSVRFSESGE
jgi:hypothetical protein